MQRLLRLASRAATAVLAAGIVSHTISAQSPLCTGVDAKHPAPLAPLQRDRPADGTTRYDMTVQQARDSTAKPLGTMTVTQKTINCGSSDVIMRVIVYDYGSAGHVVDTTLSMAATLAPISERTRKSSGDIVLDFSGRLVRGSMTRAGATRAIHDTLATPSFNSTDLELVVRSLDLRFGITTVLQIYDPEYGGYRPDSVNVVQLDPAKEPDSESTWVVHSRDRRLESTYRISERSRRLLAIDVHADSTRYRITLSDAAAKGKRM
ncbi:MAG: hypothetical protein M3Y05_09390 [Gemmatimonadota bacterium]|nr:hypothetical protein [Gemmatimonadota bacterium]